jgi:hypothetical protein
MTAKLKENLINYNLDSAPVLKSRLRALSAAPEQHMSHFWLTYGSADGLVSVVIMKASTLIHARRKATIEGIVATDAPFAEGLELSARLMELILPTEIGRKMSGSEAAGLIRRLEGRTRRDQ